MSFLWTIDNMKEFYQMTQFAHNPYYNQLHFECSPTAFTLTVSSPPSPEGRCFVELQCRAPFFHYYTMLNTDRTLLCAVSSQLFFTTFLQMERSGYDFMIFTIVHNLPTLKLSFFDLSVLPYVPRDLHVPFLSTHQDLDHHRTVSTTLLIFRTSTFQSLLAIFNHDHVTLTVTLTTSQAMFTGKVMGRDVTFIYSVQRGDCVIQGVAEGEETRFVIVLNPIESFNDILSRSHPTNSVEISKSINTNRGIISIPMGLYAQYVSYSSDR